jgi:hypothetical protein
LDMSERDPAHPLTLKDGVSRPAPSDSMGDQTGEQSGGLLGDQSGDLWAQWLPGPGMAPGFAGRDPSPKKVPKAAKSRVSDAGKTETAVPLAGYAYQYSMTGRRRTAWTEEVRGSSDPRSCSLSRDHKGCIVCCHVISPWCLVFLGA